VKARGVWYRVKKGGVLRPGFLYGFLPFALLMLFLFWPLPKPLFNDPQSTVVFDREGGLLGARIAADGQWRFEGSDILPENYISCVIEFEDNHFYRHPGVNPVAIIRALIQNIKAKRIVSGGSTITMQTIRMARGNRPRNIWQKVLEISWAFRLEIKRSKKEILQLYSDHAPFGGNVVGLEAASWRYYGRSPMNLSWSEAATLAVLPNAPALIHPGRNREALMNKRNRLLHRLLDKGKIDSLTYQSALLEPLPQKPLDLPHRADHLLDYYNLKQSGRVESTIQPWFQDVAREVIAKHYKLQSANQIHNLAALILDNETGEVIVYLGNSEPGKSGSHGQHVDIIRSQRSSGSILKPILYAAMLDDGEILPGTLVADIPTVYRDFSPENFTREYDGAVHADQALIRSLNVPAVRLLHQYGLLKFYDQLKEQGITSLSQPAEHYGLSLILGGAEVNLWDLCHLYSNWANQLLNYPETRTSEPGHRTPDIGPRTSERGPRTPDPAPRPAPFSPDAIFLTLEAMKQVRRPDAESGWKQFLSAHPIAWKTGTSFGYRDAWAVGLSPKYTVGVWVGNADGEGRPGLTGLKAAAPVLFDLFNILPDGAWFEPVESDISEIIICRESGMRASRFCEDLDTIWAPSAGLKTAICPYHLSIHLDEEGKHRVNSSCYPIEKMIQVNWFVLPPAMASYYKAKAPFYRELPPFLPSCLKGQELIPFDLIYPHPGEELFLPKNERGEKESLVFQATHSRRNTKIFWFIDNEYLGVTKGIHKMTLQPESGQHRITLTDESGSQLIREFVVK
jgi:penicillin-binding protein 1C